MQAPHSDPAAAARRAAAWVHPRLEHAHLDDLACYYKAPYLFHLLGETAFAKYLLDRIRDRFMTSEGDFLTAPGVKSYNPVFAGQDFWAYPNGWIAITAHRLGRFDLSYPAFTYLQRFHEPRSGGFQTRPPDDESPLDALTTATLGSLVCTTATRPRRAAPATGYWTCSRSSPNRVVGCGYADIRTVRLLADSLAKPLRPTSSIWTLPTRRTS
jgi:hypothetical protein